MDQPNVIKDRLIIAIDFGTTFTGVAACYSHTPEEIEVIKTWPGGNGITSDKVPTELSYDHGFRWGFQVKPGENSFTCIKLYLDSSQNRLGSTNMDRVLQQLQAHNRTPVEPASEFLTKVYLHAIDTLNKRFGATFVSTTKKQCIVTVPAIWSDGAKNATLVAARRAGMGADMPLKMISEPEAAACYALKVVQSNHLKIGNNIVVCDAGGGTVDLITYRVTGFEPLKVVESGVGTGGLCGAQFLNYRFEDHIKSRLGPNTFQHMLDKKPKAWNICTKYFEEYVKRIDNEHDEEEFNTPLPGLADNEEAGIDSGFTVVTSEEVHDIFEPLVEEVIKLIEGQVSAVQQDGDSVSAILLVGGFVMQPSNAWTAVARGAVLRGLEGTIVTDRRSRYHYGVCADSRCISGVYPEYSRFYDAFDGYDRAKHTMKWYVEKNDKVFETRAVEFPFRIQLAEGQVPSQLNELFSMTLFATAEDVAPLVFDASSMLPVCKLEVKSSGVPEEYFQFRTGCNGKMRWTLDYSVEIRIDSAQLEFGLKVDGVEYGSIAANFET